MKMSVVDKNKYPKVAYYVRVNLPDIIKVPVIVQALDQIGQVSLASLQSALVWGKGPDLSFVTMSDCGRFSPGTNSSVLEINVKLASEFESGKGVRKTKDGRDIYAIGVTILHELIHWGDDQDGVDRPGEEGNEFEIAVYGKVIPC